MRILLFLISIPLYGAGYLPGWTQLSSTTLQSVAPANGYSGSTCPAAVGGVYGYSCPPGTASPFHDTMVNVIGVWNGAAWDPVSQSMVIWGGGHGDYFGNEVYQLLTSGTPSVVRATNPTINFPGQGSGGTACPQVEDAGDGQPVSRHSYQDFAVIGNTQKLLMYSGAMWPCGATAKGTWIYDIAAKTWTQPTLSGTNRFDQLGSYFEQWAHVLYDPVSANTYILFQGSMWANTYNSGTNTLSVTRVNNASAMDPYEVNCAIDPIVRTPLGGSSGRWMVCMGNTPAPAMVINAMDLNNPSAAYVNWTSAAGGTCDPLGKAPGLVYDDAIGQFVAYPSTGGNTVYTYSTVTRTCTAITFPNGPSAPYSPEGIYGRLQYVKNGNYFVLMTSATANSYALSLDHPTTGMGNSTYTCVDVDGDGYGVGSGCTGPDADDYNAAIHTAALAKTAYGTLDALYQRSGYYPTRYWTINPSTGNDGTGASCTPANFGGGGGSDCKDFQHFTAISGSIAAGDAVVFHGGTYSYPINGVGGSAGTYVYYLAYPGELPDFVGYPNQWNMLYQGWWVMDGIKIDLQGDTTSGFGAIQCGTADVGSSSPTCANVIIRHVEGLAGTNGVYSFNGLQNILIELCSFHDMTTSHAIYLGSRGMPSNNIQIQRNILYNNLRCGIQFNGRVADLLVQQNMAYQNAQTNNGGGGADYCFENGVHDSFVRGNVSLGSAFGISLNTYDGNQWGGTAAASSCGVSGTAHCTCSASETPAGPNADSICANDEFNLVFANNTLVNTGDDVGGGDISIDPLIEIGRQRGSSPNCTTTWCVGTSFHDIAWQNNVLLTKGQSNYAPQIVFQNGITTPQSGPTNTITSTTFLETVGTAGLIGYGFQTAGTDVSTGCCGYVPYTCSTAVSGGHVGAISGCVNSNPLFASLGSYTNIPGYNLRLQASSPALAAGSTVVGNLPMDILGNFLSITSPSMGAYELSSAPPSSPAGRIISGKISLGGSVR